MTVAANGIAAAVAATAFVAWPRRRIRPNRKEMKRADLTGVKMRSISDGANKTRVKMIARGIDRTARKPSM